MTSGMVLSKARSRGTSCPNDGRCCTQPCAACSMRMRSRRHPGPPAAASVRSGLRPEDCSAATSTLAGPLCASSPRNAPMDRLSMPCSALSGGRQRGSSSLAFQPDRSSRCGRNRLAGRADRIAGRPGPRQPDRGRSAAGLGQDAAIRARPSRDSMLHCMLWRLGIRFGSGQIAPGLPLEISR